MSDERPLPLGWRLAVLLATVAALALFAWVAAQQFWRWSAPRQAAGLPAAPADPAAAIVASGLWSGTGAPLRTGGEPATGEIRLLGILAERDGRGIAVFRTRDGARAIAVGAEVVPGTSLLSVEPRSVRLREGAAERTLEFTRSDPTRGARAARATPAPKVAAAPSTANPACSVPAGFVGAVVKLHGELLDGLIAQPETWRPMLVEDAGALAVREDGGFSAMLGLAKGDRLVQANGIPLHEPDDVIGAVLRPLVASRPVRLAGTRGAQPRELFVVNATACP